MHNTAQGIISQYCSSQQPKLFIGHVKQCQDNTISISIIIQTFAENSAATWRMQRH